MQAVISKVDMHCFPAVAQWIHPQMEGSVFQQLLETNTQRLARYQSPHPLQARIENERVAAAYFTLLPGRVATLGGVRSLTGHEAVAVSLVKELIDELKSRLKLTHIQAVLAVDDEASQSILAKCGFEPLATVQHLWCFGITIQRPHQTTSTIPPSARWLPASGLSMASMSILIAKTFIDTLDCPALNGKRSSQEVLESFLDGQPLAAMANWELLEVDGKIVGCLMLKHYVDNRVTELEYMAVVPERRGQKLGELLIARTFEQAKSAKAEVIVVAVDEKNVPALDLYRRSGFSHHTSWAVWLCD